MRESQPPSSNDVLHAPKTSRGATQWPPYRSLRSLLGPLAFRVANRQAIAREQARLAGLPLVGGMASIPTRAADLARVIDHVLPQVDRLHLFLHGYEAIPETARRPGITVCAAAVDHPYRASGKLHGLTREAEPCMYFGFDDDIIYSSGHVQRLRSALLRYGGRALVGIHGVSFLDATARYTEHRRTHQFPRGLRVDRLVDQIGMGTAAFVSDALAVDPTAWLNGDMDDIMMAIEAEKAGLPRIAIHRQRHSLIPLMTAQDDSLWSRSKRDDSRQTVQLAELMRLMGRLDP